MSSEDERSHAEQQWREILGQRLLQYFEQQALTPGEVGRWLNRILAREVDPEAAASAVVTKALGRSDAKPLKSSCGVTGVDHVGIAVADPAASLKFFTDVLGLSSDEPQDIKGQNTRVRFVDTGDSKLELVESLAPDSPIGKYIEKRGPGIHHVALRVADIHAAIAAVTNAGVRMIDQQPRRGAHGSQIAFVHPGDTHGVLVELKQPADSH